MSPKYFLYNEADFNINEYLNFINIFDKEGIDEMFLEEKKNDIINILSALTGITLSEGNKLTEETSNDFKNSLNDQEFKEKLIIKIIALKSEIEIDDKVFTDFGLNTPSKVLISISEKLSTDTNIKNNDRSTSSIDTNSNSNGPNTITQTELPKTKVTITAVKNNRRTSNNEISQK